MGSHGILLSYQERIISLQTSASQLRPGQIIAFSIMFSAVAAIFLMGFLSLARQRFAWPWMFTPSPVALYAGLLGRKRNAALLRTLRLESYYERGIARLTGKWAGSEADGSQFVPAEHAYAQDLHVVGTGSLFELLCTCRTEAGRRQLANYLLTAPTLQETQRRQEAVQELQDRSDLRERVHLLGQYAFEQTNWETITAWLDSPASPASFGIRMFALITSTALAVLFLLGWAHVAAWSALVWPIGALLAVNGVTGMLYRNGVLASLPDARSVGRDLSVLRDGLRLMQAQSFRTALLSELVEGSRRGDPYTRLRQLDRLIHALRERDKEWFYLGSRVLLIGTQVFWAIQQWRRVHAEAMRRWLSVWGEFEALLSLANYAYEHPDHSFPRLCETGTILESEGMGHPLLPPDACVRNDVSFSEQSRFYIISGSNMAGKSTMLRTIGLNAVLAYSGAPVCAKKMVLSRFAICASLAVQDSLLQGKSKFLAEIERLRQALTVPAGRGPVLFLIDEILSGTNSQDRRVAAEVILRELLRQGAMGAISTHDLALTELATQTDLRGTNVHMGSKDESDPLHFDYVLKPGVTQQSSALALARLAGVPV